MIAFFLKFICIEKTSILKLIKCIFYLNILCYSNDTFSHFIVQIMFHYTKQTNQNNEINLYDFVINENHVKKSTITTTTTNNY